MTSEEFEQLKAFLQQLVTELEDIWLEAEAFRQLAITMGLAKPETLDQIAEAARNDPKQREYARKRFAQMHHALNQTGDALWFADFPHKPSGSEKPN